MTFDFKKDASLWVAIAIPILMIILVAVAVYLPAKYVKPVGVFLYVDQNRGQFDSKFEYFVKNGKLDRREVEFSEAPKAIKLSEPRIFIYDIKTDERKELTFSDAQKLTLTDNRNSEQGFEIVEGRGGGDLFFDGGSEFGSVFAKKGAYSKKLDLGGKKFFEIEIIGWVK